jgi:methionyl-tRNA formyltransferase
MKIAILTTPDQWFSSYAKKLQQSIPEAKLFLHHEELDKGYDIVFILSYHHIIPKKVLEQNRHNLVIHASALPYGKGWAPMFWQILEGKDQIPFTMFEASDGVDNGNIYMKKVLTLSGYELNEELRKKQADFIIEMCLEFLKNYDIYKESRPQSGEESFYPKRAAKDSELDINKSIKEQFNLLRIANNEEYPAFFDIDGHRYTLKIAREEDENR